MAGSPSTATTTSAGDLQESFSDDSGVDVKCKRLKTTSESSRRNKRKSSEPKKRKDVLLMKRWDTEDEDDEEGERPSSGDSGCQVDAASTSDKRKRTWRKCEELVRQSVICEATSTNCQVSPVLADESPDEPRRSVGRPRNYKSMSRQRRIEANARERTRVHTISAAFESLRRAVPAYAHNQKLSKLAILRIASAYIVALACLNQQESGQESSGSSLAQCVEQCTRTIQAEGRSRRRTSKE